MTPATSVVASQPLAPVVPVTTTPSWTEDGQASTTLYDKCMALASNLWWTWNPEVITLFQDIDPARWRALDHNPIALLSEFSPINCRPGPWSWCCKAGSTRHTDG